MKEFIDSCLVNYAPIFPNEAEVLNHLFTVLGNGVELDDDMLIEGSNSPYEFPEPVAIRAVYPLSNYMEFKPYLKYKGCKSEGFKEAVKYFIECLKVSKDHSYAEIQPWISEIPHIEIELL